MTWIVERLRQLLCSIRGHDTILHYEPGRLSLRCLTCSYQTSGWNLGPEIRYAPSSANGNSPSPGRTLERPLMIVDASSGASFAHRSARVDRFDDGSTVRRPRTLGDQPESRGMRLAS